MRIAVIGAGTIGGAIAAALKEAGHDVVATRRNVDKAAWLKDRGIPVLRDNRKAVESAEVVFLAVKPSKVRAVLEETADAIEGKIVISVVAGIRLKELKRLANAKFVRAMPNIAILVRESFTAYSTDDLDSGEIRLVESLMKTFGVCARVEEEHMDAITGLSGSGPAYVTVFLEAMMYGGLRTGLPRDIAKLAALQTLLGTARLLMETEAHPAEVREWVITPGGTTIDGVFELEEGKIRTAVMKAVDAAAKKSRILSRRV
ncbi:pyrroline-5-carboxylate reductase [Thermococcus thioreducens]|uniref:Pyrroline-5-carboxylate reductase n=1 Tax=Thermococcus thioreducens TaxID=277988 RepID=A0A0Q2RDN5_9EURY|nr:pyrroline-5-carboxylate reductase [Thermococcus thioreducens]ASJ12733.1 pyrroline-5-carboxylate reductase [Thermococcus thioreducens]KQH82062.1 pyrroline-5-carboxylate reductase [Thermococcus thioreducens]SEV86045.1 pyrroline-5-carboxylate reductase [Thermococcus thioreducens]